MTNPNGHKRKSGLCSVLSIAVAGTAFLQVSQLGTYIQHTALSLKISRYLWGSMQRPWLALWWCSALVNTHLNTLWDVPPSLYLQFSAMAVCSPESLPAVQCRGRMFLQTSIHNSVLWLLSTLFWLLQNEQITRLHRVSLSLLSNSSVLVFTLFAACSVLSLKELPA